MPKRFRPARCVICGDVFTPRTGRNTCCSAACRRERRLRCCRAWYRANRTAHIARVLRRRRAHAKAAGASENPCRPD